MYRYRCGECHASSTETRTRGAAEALGAEHRAAVHGGLVPDGEQIYRRRQHPDAPDWRIAALALAGAVAGLLADLIHHL